MLDLGDFVEAPGRRVYRSVLTARCNLKGVLDVDTVKGCELGLRAYPDGGCYGECYALKTARQYGIDFSTSINRCLYPSTVVDVFWTVKNYPATWYRVGTAGDPCHDWEHSISVCEELKPAGKTPVFITKHWRTMTDAQLNRLSELGAVVNTSTSGLDTEGELRHRVGQIERLQACGVVSVCRVVTCRFGNSEWARECNDRQEWLLQLRPVIDNPLRARKSNPRVVSGDVLLERCKGAIGGGKMVSLHSHSVYIGACGGCPDQCGVADNSRGL